MTENEIKMADQIIQLLDHCSDNECSICAQIICPHKHEFHFHHDGCPACGGMLD